MCYFSQHHTIRLAGAIMLVIFVALAAGGRRVLAQSIDDLSPAGDSSLDVNSAPSTGDRLVKETEPPAIAADTPTASGSDDPVSYTTSGNSEVKDVPSGGAVAAEASAPDSETSAVLEIPQVLNLPSRDTAGQPPERALADGDANDDDAQPSQDGQDIAEDRDVAAMADQVGTLQDYEDQALRAPAGGMIFAPGMAVMRLPSPPLVSSRPMFSPRPMQRFPFPAAAAPIILPPTSSGPFPSTSPMLMGPAFGTIGSFPRGGLLGVHR
jgi:hypothetical protein